MAKRKRKFKTVEWTELESGDCIKVTNGHGSHMIINGRQHHIGVPGGDYRVQYLKDQGIVARGKNGFCFIYMGPERDSALGIQAPHKFKKYLTNPVNLV